MAQTAQVYEVSGETSDQRFVVRHFWTLLAIALALFVALAIWQATGFGQRTDLAFSQNIWQYRSPGLTYRMQLLTLLGENDVLAWITAAVCAVLFAHALLIGEFIWAKGKIMMVSVTMLATMGIMHLLKLIFGRPRPPHEFLLGEPLQTYSFPSGHATMTMTLVGLLLILFYRSNLPHLAVWLLSAILLPLTFLVGFSRIYLGYHYASDVLAGFLIGLIAILIAERLTKPTA